MPEKSCEAPVPEHVVAALRPAPQLAMCCGNVWPKATCCAWHASAPWGRTGAFTQHWQAMLYRCLPRGPQPALHWPPGAHAPAVSTPSESHSSDLQRCMSQLQRVSSYARGWATCSASATVSQNPDTMVSPCALIQDDISSAPLTARTPGETPRGFP